MNIALHVKRLMPGTDLKLAIQDIVETKGINAGTIASCVGSLSELHIRLAGARETLNLKGEFEIVSLMGTLTPAHQHIHLSVSDTTCSVLGGHLLPGCFIDSTAELVIHVYPDATFKRQIDSKTGYSELTTEI